MWVHVHKDSLITARPMLLRQLVLIPDGTGPAIATFHDGRNANAPHLGIFRTNEQNTRSISFGKGIRMENGLYVEVGGDVEGVIVIWDSLEE
ncbi:unnamed protein product [marine sediment metagenome]|uniref:Uncharacterized protein n=1 Tax=marine sediment metagenome TaxID=412755 RepID=X1SJN5_9ZZZZ